MEQLTLEQAALLHANKAINSHRESRRSFTDSLNISFQAGAEWQKEQDKQLLILLKGIAEWPGNLRDEVLQTRTGPNDAALRGGIICDMRNIAIEAIRRYEPDYTPFKQS